jgi:hypothetical protein
MLFAPVPVLLAEVVLQRRTLKGMKLPQSTTSLLQVAILGNLWRQHLT